MHSLSADNRHIGRYIVQLADDRIYADYLQYRISRISVSANFPNLDIVCTLMCATEGTKDHFLLNLNVLNRFPGDPVYPEMP